MSDMNMREHEEYGELGKSSVYNNTYNSEHLFAIPRAPKWHALGIQESALPFVGCDTWTHYEVSWLNAKGKPCVAVACISYDCSSPYLIESKSLKLYFNSLNQTQFSSVKALLACIREDLSSCLQTEVDVVITPSSQWRAREVQPHFKGLLVDDLDVTCIVYEVDASLLKVEDEVVKEVLCSDLLRSNCPVTNQPDWGSVVVQYEGQRLVPESFLKYVVSYRNHQGFHEQCIEQIFLDILRACNAKHLTVYGRYTRRGGIDINPYRTTHASQDAFASLQVELMRQ